MFTHTRELKNSLYVTKKEAKTLKLSELASIHFMRKFVF